MAFPKLPRVSLHPQALKHMLKGHPWVTADGYTARYPQKEAWLMGQGEGGKDLALLLHDPGHPHVKARVWAKSEDIPADAGDIKIWFRKELGVRLQAAFRRRDSLIASGQRQNVYLAFGEADGLPGLFAQLFAGQVLIQTYSSFWTHWQSAVLQEVQKELPGLGVWWQERSSQGQTPPAACGEGTFKEITCLEYGVRYKVRPDSAYDQGLYTDMAGIRSRLAPHYPPNARVLNLFCYTGAFSLHALSLGAASVVSVDLSKKYLAWLDENLILNPQLDPSRHLNMAMSVERALADLRSQGQLFDLVICDPPSASSDGNKTTAALKAYETLLPAILEVTAPGGKILACLNTHQVGRQKFELRMKEQIESLGKPARVQESWALGVDCPLIKHFPEGDYLKALLIHKKPAK